MIYSKSSMHIDIQFYPSVGLLYNFSNHCMGNIVPKLKLYYSGIDNCSETLSIQLKND